MTAAAQVATPDLLAVGAIEANDERVPVAVVRVIAAAAGGPAARLGIAHHVEVVGRAQRDAVAEVVLGAAQEGAPGVGPVGVQFDHEGVGLPVMADVAAAGDPVGRIGVAADVGGVVGVSGDGIGGVGVAGAQVGPPQHPRVDDQGFGRVVLADGEADRLVVENLERSVDGDASAIDALV